MKAPILFSLHWAIMVSILCLITFSCTQKEMPPAKEIKSWLTTFDKSSLFKPQGVIAFGNNSLDGPIIGIDTTQKFQEVDGFGFTLTGGSAQLIMGLSKPRRDSLLRQLLDRKSVV